MSFSISAFRTTRENAAAETKAQTDAVRENDAKYPGQTHERELGIIESTVAAFVEKTPDGPGFEFSISAYGHSDTAGGGNVSVSIATVYPAPKE